MSHGVKQGTIPFFFFLMSDYYEIQISFEFSIFFFCLSLLSSGIIGSLHFFIIIGYEYVGMCVGVCAMISV